MNRQTLIAFFVILGATAAEAQQQRLDIDPNRFNDFAESMHQVTPDGVLIHTISEVGGGAWQCVNTPGPVRDFGGTVTIAPANGLGANEGAGGIMLIPFTGPNCTGEELAPVPGTPPIRSGTTPYNSAVSVRSAGTVPTYAQSVCYVVILAAAARMYEILLAGGFILFDINTTAPGPDLQPQVTLSEASLQWAMNSSGSWEPVPTYRALGHGDTVRRGFALQVKVDVVNHGPGVHEGFWSIRVDLPQRYSSARGWPGCDDVRGGVSTSTQTIPVGGKVTKCQVFVIDQPGGDSYTIGVLVGTAFDINQTNNSVRTHPIEIQSTRGEPYLEDRIFQMVIPPARRR